MVCGYIHTGEAPPATCPKCRASYEEFTEIK
ncbi:rubredoxin [Candidatus Woesearchaeota archaeon]|nr:rubredoxin [Candidatus Woesearchaeota archaeon]